MSDIALRVENLGKAYRIAGPRRAVSYRTLQDELLSLPKRLLSRRRAEIFWALRDCSFEVRTGEVVGIIGRNGAGKSTLLKILSRITEPSTGEALIYGRVGSLLEVGTGFHPELTGRENVFLSGAILGMRREEIARRFDEIVAFAEVEQFIETPVKHYSTGMYMRLAFAVAAHLEPEVLIIDEVLAVGDAAFQKKCLGKMSEVAKGGRTVLFVSHNMGAVRSLCQSGLLFHEGQLVLSDTAVACVDTYLRQYQQAALGAHTATVRPLGAPIWMTDITMLCDGAPSSYLPTGSQLSFEVRFMAERPISEPRIGFVISQAQGEMLINANNTYQPSIALAEPTTQGSVRCDLGMLPLMAGRYSVSFWFGEPGADHHIVEHVLSFDVIAQDIWGGGRLPPSLTPLWWPTRFEAQPALVTGDG